jgi:FkbM family methyltransferase
VTFKDVLRRCVDRIIPIPRRNSIRLALKRHPFEYQSRWPDIEIFKLGRRDVVFDVGANVGDFTECVLAYQPWAVVHAFEPLPSAFAVLYRKFADYPEIYCNKTALGSTQSVLSLNVSSYEQASSFLPNGRVLDSGVYGIDFTVANTIDVPVDTLANYTAQRGINRIKLLKIDVQGFEIEVLKGAEPVIPYVDYIFAEAHFQEMYKGGPLFTDLFDFLNAKGHQLVRMTAFRLDDDGKLMECDMIFKNQRLTGRRSANARTSDQSRRTRCVQ